jgi:hypothetical protein
VHRQHIVAVDLHHGYATRYSLLRQRLGRRLAGARRRYGPLIVGDNENHGKAPDAGDVDPGIDVALGGRAIAKDADGSGILCAIFEGNGNAGSMQRLVADRDADRQIALHGRRGPRLAALAAGEILQQVADLDAAPDLCRAFAIGRHKNVRPAHRGGNADRHRLLAEGGSIGAGAASALQAHELCIEGAGKRHKPINPAQEIAIARQVGQIRKRVPLLVEILPPAHLESRHDCIPLGICWLHLPLPSLSLKTRDWRSRPAGSARPRRR